jgi:hypothetical protein
LSIRAAVLQKDEGDAKVNVKLSPVDERAADTVGKSPYWGSGPRLERRQNLRKMWICLVTIRFI